MNFFQQYKQHHYALLLLALPMILSNITTPLLGLVDTAVIGHLGKTHYLAGIALGSATISMLFWLAGFLRMSTTGLVAGAFGEKNHTALLVLLLQGLLFALVIALILILLNPLLIQGIALFSEANPATLTQAENYFSIRIYSAPAALCNMVLLGWMLGVHYAKGSFLLVLITNLINIVLDVVFVVYLDMAVAGAAWASLIADYSALIFALFLAAKLCKKHKIPLNFKKLNLFNGAARLASLNGDIFFRSLLLQSCLIFMTFYGARLGDTILAANAVLLNFLLLISFSLDGIAYAAEAKVGTAKGAKNLAMLKLWVKISFFWAVVFALIYTLIFAIFGVKIIALLTNIQAVIQLAQVYLPWLIFMPLIAISCYLFDGIFVGLMRAKDMRNSMFIAASIGFFGVFSLTTQWGNHGLWAAMTSFMLLRGLTLIARYLYLYRADQLLK